MLRVQQTKPAVRRADGSGAQRDDTDQVSNSARREMAKTISRFAMPEHADLTFGTKQSCLDGTQTTRKAVDGPASVARSPANVFPARNRDYGSAVWTFRIMRRSDFAGSARGLDVRRSDITHS
jgi:hypothetical protein